MKLKYHKLLSTFALNFNLRRYTTNNNRKNAQKVACARCALGPVGDRCRDKGRDCDPANAAFCNTVGRCRLTVSKPVL